MPCLCKPLICEAFTCQILYNQAICKENFTEKLKKVKIELDPEYFLTRKVQLNM